MDYSNRLLNNLSDLINDALDCNDSSPQDIYDTIKNTIVECRSYHKERSTRAYQLLSLLNGNRSFEVDTSLDDINASKKPGISSASQKDWTSFWEEYHYPEEVKDDGMRPWGHSDLEYGLANDILTKDRISNFPGEQYTEEELNAMCDAAQDKEKCREYNLREAEYYNKRAQLDAELDAIKRAGGFEWTPDPVVSRNDETRLMYERGWVYESPDGGKTVTKRRVGSTEKTIVKADGYSTSETPIKWVLPVQQSYLDGVEDYFVEFPNDLLEAANLKEGDSVEWIDNKDGSYTLRKVSKK